jgi:hypothetical protein
MSRTSRRMPVMARATLAVSVATAVISGTSNAWAATAADTIPPSIPTNVHQVGADLPRNQSSIAWDASTDDSGSIAFYWVKNLHLRNRVKPRTNSVPLSLLLLAYSQEPPKSIMVTVQAVDPAGNVSAPSAPIEVIIN